VAAHIEEDDVDVLDEQPPAAPPRRQGTLRGALVGLAAITALVVVGVGIADAQSDSPPTTQAPANGTAPAPDAPPPGPGPGRGFRGGHKGIGMAGGIHGEFVRPDGNGGYQTIATQLGEVTAVSSSSITVKSEDGFSKTYSVDEGTMVNAGRDGIADVKNGDKVRVLGVVSGSTTKAVDIADVTNIREHRQQWAPEPPAGAPEGGGVAPSAFSD
jgi:hypothetical protein